MSILNEIKGNLKHLYADEIELMVRSFHSKNIVNTIKETIDETVYNAYSPKQYNRTYELRDSVRLMEIERGYVSDSPVVWFIYGHDDSAMHSYSPSENPKLGRGWSLKSTDDYPKGSDFSPYIPWAIHEGKSGDAWGVKNPVWYAPKPYMEKAGDKIKNKYGW